jgi:hypothetical protein
MTRPSLPAPRCTATLRLPALLAVGVSGVLLGLACDDECTRGSEGCRCTGAGECVTGLACLSEYCVDAEGSADADDGSPADDGGAIDNVAACEDFIAAFQCGTSDLAQFLPCDSYGMAACDLTAFFDCLADHTGCNAGTPDISGWMQCTDLSTCD